jgi:hypothetical protein
MLFSESFYFLQENFNIWIEEKHKIIDVPFSAPDMILGEMVWEMGSNLEL